jgi:hypothetical protein
MAEITADVTVRRVEDVMTAPADDELVLLRAETNEYFGLDAVGARIWELLATPSSVDGMVPSLVTEFDVDAETCRADVLALVTRLVAAGLATAG